MTTAIATGHDRSRSTLGRLTCPRAFRRLISQIQVRSRYWKSRHPPGFSLFRTDLIWHSLRSIFGPRLPSPMHPSRDHHLPPDPDAYRHAPHPTGRIIVIAPTRAACETIELALGLQLDTLLEREHGEEIRALAGVGQGFRHRGGHRHRQDARHPADRRVDPGGAAPVGRGQPGARGDAGDAASWNVVIVTTGIARRWFQDDLITGRDTVIVDEIHQTSAELELCLALGKRAGCRFIWLSATVDPDVLRPLPRQRGRARDLRLRPRAQGEGRRCCRRRPKSSSTSATSATSSRRRRGVAVFVPTRAEVERLAVELGEQWKRLTTAFYHGGEPIRVIRPVSRGRGGAAVPAGDDRGRPVGAQRARARHGRDLRRALRQRGRARPERAPPALSRRQRDPPDGRTGARPGAETAKSSSSATAQLDFEQLQPDAARVPARRRRRAGGDHLRRARAWTRGISTCRWRSTGPAYRRALELLTSRGLVENGRLTAYGREVEAMPVERPWGELLVHADERPAADRGGLLQHRIAAPDDPGGARPPRRRRQRQRPPHRLQPLRRGGEPARLHRRGVRAAAAPLRGRARGVGGAAGRADQGDRGHRARPGVGVPLARAAAAQAAALRLEGDPRRAGRSCVARVMPFDLVIDEHTADGQEARVSKTSVAGSWGAVAGSAPLLRRPVRRARASIEGTTISYDLVHAVRRARPGRKVVLTGPRKHQRLALERRRTYFGFDLDTEVEPILGDRSLSRSAPRPRATSWPTRSWPGRSTHPDASRIRRAVSELDELWRRSGGEPGRRFARGRPRWAAPAQLEAVRSLGRLPLHTRLALDPAELVDRGDPARGSTRCLGWSGSEGTPRRSTTSCQNGDGVARVRLREGQAKRLRADELPPLDRPLRFAVQRGRHAPLLADTVPELQALLRRALRNRHGGRTDGPGGAPGPRAVSARDRRPGRRR